jgi:hypothetical protein
MEREKSKFEEEQDAGHRSSAREQTEAFAEEVEAGRSAVERVRARLKEEQGVGRRTAERHASAT